MLFEKLKESSTAALANFATAPFVVATRSGTVTRERYMQFLNDLYHVVWHFCPTMAAGASRCNDEYASVRYALYEHVEEEKGHELWVLEDCKAVGGDAFMAQVKGGLPRAEIQAMNAFNYYVTERQHGASAFGMVFALEIIAQTLAGRLGEGLGKALGLDYENGVKFLSTHGPMDEQHLIEISGSLNSISDKKVCDVIANAVAVNIHLFGAMVS